MSMRRVDTMSKQASQPSARRSAHILIGRMLKPRGEDIAANRGMRWGQLSPFAAASGGADEWKERFVVLTESRDGVVLRYGAAPDRLDKSIPVKSISEVRALNAGKALDAGCPLSLTEHCWVMLTDAKRYVFAVSPSERVSRDTWVQQLQKHSGAVDVPAEMSGEGEVDSDEDLDDASDDAPPDPSKSDGPPSPQRAAAELFIYRRRVRELQAQCGWAPASICFAASVVRLSSAGAEQACEVVIAGDAMWVLKDSVLGLRKKKVSVKQISEVVEDSSSDSRVAVVWPEGHDWVFSFCPPDGKSNAAAVRKAFVERLSQTHFAASGARRLVQRESGDIKGAVRLARTDRPVALESRDLDHYRIAKHRALYPLLRSHHDSQVLFSGYIMKHKLRGGQTDKILAITNLALYYLPAHRRDLDRRIDLTEVDEVLHDGNKHVLVKVSQGQSRSIGAKSGDLLFEVHRNLSAIISVLQRSVSVRQVGEDEVLQKAKLEKAGYLEKGVVAVVRATTKTADKALDEFGRGAKKVTQAIVHSPTNVMAASQAVADGVQSAAETIGKGVVHAGNYGVSQIGEATGLSTAAGKGLSKALLKALDYVRVPREQLTSPRGNAVILEGEQPSKATGVVELRVLQAAVKCAEDLVDNLGIASDDRPHTWFACACRLRVEQTGPTKAVLFVTSQSVYLLQGQTIKTGRETVMRGPIRLPDVGGVLECEDQPLVFALLLEKDVDMILEMDCQITRRRLFRHLVKRYPLVKRRVGDEKGKQLRWFRVKGETALTRAVKRSKADDPPKVALENGDADELKIARTEKLIALLRKHGESRVAFSGFGTTGIDPPKKAIVVVTSIAVYLLTPKKEGGLGIEERFDLRSVSGVRLSVQEDREVLVRVTNVRLSLRLHRDMPSPPEYYEARLAAALNTEIDSVDSVEVVAIKPGVLEARIASANDADYDRMEPILRSLPDKQAFREAFPHISRIKLDFQRRDVLIWTDRAESFVEHLCRERMWWTAHVKPELWGPRCSAANTPDVWPVTFVSDSVESVALRGGGAALPKASEVRESILAWSERRVEAAMHLRSADLLAHELSRARKLRLAPAETSRRATDGEQNTFTKASHMLERLQEAEGTRAALLQAIEDGDWDGFEDHLGFAGSLGLLGVYLKDIKGHSFDDNEFTCVEERPMTVDDARAHCLREEGISGFTYSTRDRREDGTVLVRFVAPKPQEASEAPSAGSGWKTLKRRRAILTALRGPSRADAEPVPEAAPPDLPSQPDCVAVLKEDELAELRKEARSRAAVLAEIATMRKMLTADTARPVDVAHFRELFTRGRAAGWDDGRLHSAYKQLSAAVQSSNLLQIVGKLSEQPADFRRRVEEAWKQLCADGAESAESSFSGQLGGCRAGALAPAKAHRRFQLAMEKGDRKTAEALLAEHSDLGDSQMVSKELSSVVDRDAVAERARQALLQHQRLVTIAASGAPVTEAEMESTMSSLTELAEQTRRYPSLRSQSLQVKVLLDRLQWRVGAWVQQRKQEERIAERMAQSKSKLHEAQWRAWKLERRAKELANTARDLYDSFTRGTLARERHEEVASGAAQCREKYKELSEIKAEYLESPGDCIWSYGTALLAVFDALEHYNAVELAFQVPPDQFAYAILRHQLGLLIKQGKQEEAAQALRLHMTATSDTPLRQQDIQHFRALVMSEKLSKSRSVELRSQLESAIAEQDREALGKVLGQWSFGGVKEKGECKKPQDDDKSPKGGIMSVVKELGIPRMRLGAAAEALQGRMASGSPDGAPRQLSASARQGSNATSSPRQLSAATAGPRQPSATSGQLTAGDDDDDDDDEGDGGFRDSDDDLSESSLRGALTNASVQSPVRAASDAPAPPKPEEPEPAPTSPELQKLQKALTDLQGSSQRDALGLFRCDAANPACQTFVDTWKEVLQERLRPVGMFRKSKRGFMDVMTEASKEVYSVEQAIPFFEATKKLNKTMQKSDDNVVCLRYLMHSGRFYQTIVDLLMTPDVLGRLYFENAICRDPSASKFLLKRVMPEVKIMRFDFRYMLTRDDQAYLETIDGPVAAAVEPPSPPPVPEPPQQTEAEQAPEPEPEEVPAPAEPEDAKTSAPKKAVVVVEATPMEEEGEEEEPVQDVDEEDLRNALDPRHYVTEPEEFERANGVEKLSLSIQKLHAYFRASRDQPGRQGRLGEVFEEQKNTVIGLLVRERLCPALVSLFRAGFKEEKLFGKRHVWQFVEAVAQQCRSNSLGGALNSAIGSVAAIVDKDMSLSSPTSGKRQQFAVFDTRLRVLLCRSLNELHTRSYVQTLYDLDKIEMLKEWYNPDAPMLSRPVREQLDTILVLLSKIPFHLNDS